MAAWLCLFTFALLQLTAAQFLSPPATATTLPQLVVGAVELVSWDLPSDATTAQNQLWLFYTLTSGPTTGFYLTNTTLSQYDWTVSAYGIDLSTVSFAHMTLYPGDKAAVAGNGYFTTADFLVVDASSASTTSSSTSATSTSPITGTSSTPSTSSSPTTTDTTAPAVVSASPSASVSQSSAPASTGLSTGAKAGVGIGAAIGILFLAAMAYFFGRRHQRKNSTSDPTTETADEPYPRQYGRTELPSYHGEPQQISGKDNTMTAQPKPYYVDSVRAELPGTY